jgi:glycosyltransferase involved in cell wall biosynthesis
MTFCPGGWKQKVHYLFYFLITIKYVIKEQIRWIYASDLLSCPIGLTLSIFPKVSIIYHEHDSPDSQAKHNFFMKACFLSRKLLARRSKAYILPNHKRLNKFMKEILDLDLQRANLAKGRGICTWNCPSLEELDYLSSRDSDPQCIRLWYHGSIVPPQLPLTVIDAIANVPSHDVQFYFAGYETIGHQGYIKEILSYAQAQGVEHDNIKYLGTLSTRKQLYQECSKCNVGLALFQKPTREPMAGASNKPFDYMACGLALLVTDLPDWQEMFSLPGYALACDPESSKSITDSLLYLIKHPELMREMGERGRKKILNEWNYEKQFEPVLEVLESQAS